MFGEFVERLLEMSLGAGDTARRGGWRQIASHKGLGSGLTNSLPPQKKKRTGTHRLLFRGHREVLGYKTRLNLLRARAYRAPLETVARVGAACPCGHSGVRASPGCRAPRART